MHKILYFALFWVIFAIIPPNCQYLAVILTNCDNIWYLNTCWLAIFVRIFVPLKVQINVTLQNSAVIVNLGRRCAVDVVNFVRNRVTVLLCRQNRYVQVEPSYLFLTQIVQRHADTLSYIGARLQIRRFIRHNQVFRRYELADSPRHRLIIVNFLKRRPRKR